MKHLLPDGSENPLDTPARQELLRRILKKISKAERDGIPCNLDAVKKLIEDAAMEAYADGSGVDLEDVKAVATVLRDAWKRRFEN